ncbi:hypothetical protein G6514_004133 [Epicoccum nigrum]|nr:hypothetical protein G6514_004133 [Epicoccum nigrum]
MSEQFSDNNMSNVNDNLFSIGNVDMFNANSDMLGGGTNLLNNGDTYGYNMTGTSEYPTKSFQQAMHGNNNITFGHATANTTSFNDPQGAAYAGQAARHSGSMFGGPYGHYNYNWPSFPRNSEHVMPMNGNVPAFDPQGYSYGRGTNGTISDVSDLDLSCTALSATASPRDSRSARFPSHLRASAQARSSRTDTRLRQPVAPHAAPRHASAGGRVSLNGGVAKIKKNGQPYKARLIGRKLCLWEKDDLEKAVIGLIIAANKVDANLDYELAASFIGVTAGAFQQAIVKIHKKLTGQGMDLPKIHMKWKPRDRSLIVALMGYFNLK